MLHLLENLLVVPAFAAMGGRIVSLDRHTYCYKCRGYDCDMNKCDDCMSWTKGEMKAYIKLRKSLMSKSRHRKSVSKSSSPPRSSAPLLDLGIDDRFQSQLDSINKSIDSKIAALSENLFAQFSSVLGQFKL